MFKIEIKATGPAGCGKTRALDAIKHLLETQYGMGEVLFEELPGMEVMELIQQSPMPQAKGDEEALTVQDYEEVLADKRRLTRELDVLLNGKGAAPQASLCDIVAQVQREGIRSKGYAE
jgi:ABC-type glutathione transport system ATPase component